MKPGVTCQKLIFLNKISPVIEKTHLFIQVCDVPTDAEKRLCEGAEWVIGCANPMFLLVDNSDSPSVVEQLQQGHGSGCYTFISKHS